jgi:hypothetical protein
LSFRRRKMGTGKLYRFGDNQFVANVDYQLFHDEAATNWWGELSLMDYTPLGDEDRYIIELEDKRKSRCYLKKRVNRAVSGVPPCYIYHITGLNLLE